jgi:hypothetical protein
MDNNQMWRIAATGDFIGLLPTLRVLREELRKRWRNYRASRRRP